MVVILLCFAGIHVALLAWSFGWHSACPWRQWLLRVMLLGTVYDNFVVAMAPVWLGSAGYEVANIPRFFIHAAVLPFLVLFALSVMGSAGVKLALNRLFRAFCCLFVLAALCFGLWHEVWLLELAPKTALGFTRLSSAATLPPLATIFSNLLVLPMAALVWRQSGWSWFFLGALFIFLVNGAGASQPWGFLAGNGAECLFLLCLLATERRFAQFPSKQQAGQKHDS